MLKKGKRVSNVNDSILLNAKVNNDSDCLIPYTAEEAMALMASFASKAQECRYLSYLFRSEQN